MSRSSTLVVPAAKKHTATVLWLHGLGDSAAGWVGLGQNWRQRGKFEHVQSGLTWGQNMGMSMPGWYDIATFDDLAQRSQDDAGVIKTRDYINQLISQEIEQHGIPPSRIVLGGFSQGGAMSLFTSMTTTHKLAGFVALSGYLVLGEKAKELGDALPSGGPNKETPVFMGTGDADPLVRYEWAKASVNLLQKWGRQVNFKVYKGLEHSAEPQEIDDVESFLNTVIPLQDSTPSKA